MHNSAEEKRRAGARLLENALKGHKILAGGRPSDRTPDGLPPDLEILCYVPLPPMTGEGVRG